MSGGANGISSNGVVVVLNESTPDILHKPVIPVMLVGNDEEDEDNDEVKSKPPQTHTRGSSLSSSGLGSHLNETANTTTTTTTTSNTSSTSSLSNSLQTTGTSNMDESESSMMLAALSLSSHQDKDKSDTITRLLEEIVALKIEVEKLKEENNSLKKIREELDNELHTLTENLFEEAYKMVDEAKGERFSAEKKLADATGQIEAMETQVSTLHNLLKSTPKSSPTTKHKKPSVRKLVRKLSRQSIGKHSSKHKEPAAAASPITEHKSLVVGGSLKEGTILPNDDFTSFKDWIDGGLNRNHCYYESILSLHIQPCLDFKNIELSERLYRAIESNELVIEPVTLCSVSEEATTDNDKSCDLSGDQACTYRFKLPDSPSWYYMTPHCRDRIVSVCEFYTFIGYIKKGIIKKEVAELYWQVARHRAVMGLARLSLTLP